MKKPTYDQLTKRISATIDARFTLWGEEDYKKLSFGDFLITGASGPRFERVIGYVVQVRVRAGAFGSDMVLMRHKDGNLVCHENQTFSIITNNKQIKLLREHWEFLPELEQEEAKIGGCSGRYTLRNKEFPETGFIIPEKKQGEDTGASHISFTMAVMDS